jgi:hypothetical protein
MALLLEFQSLGIVKLLPEVSAMICVLPEVGKPESPPNCIQPMFSLHA